MRTQFEFVRFLSADVAVSSGLGGGEALASTQPDQLAAVLERANVGGVEWIRVQIGSSRTDYRALYGWVPRIADVSSGGPPVRIDPVYEPATLTCPTEAPTVTSVAVMLPAHALECYGTDTLRFSPVQVRKMFSEEGDFVTGQPAWLALDTDLWLFDSHEGGLTNSMGLHVDPASGIAVPTDEWLEIEGRFDHPASATCQRTGDLSHLATANRAEAVLWCREQFVVSAFRVLPEPERPPSPAPPPTAGPPATRTVSITTHEITGPLAPRFEASGVWTGSEVIVWGGTDGSGGRLFSDGAAYDPDRDRWRVIADGPLAERHGHLAAWTGSEMLIWGGHRRNYIEPPDGAAYDPLTDRWREITDGPLEWRYDAASVWTGSEWIVAVTDGRARRTDVAAYDPASDEWRTLPSLAAEGGEEKNLAWTGDQVVLREQGGTLQRLPLDADAWIPIDPVPGGLPIIGPIAWTGEQVIGVAYQYLGNDQPRYWAHLVGWDPASGTWQSLPAPPRNIVDAHLVWADGRAIALGTDLAYDVASQAWWEVSTPDLVGQYGTVVVWAGDRLFVWGGGLGHGSEPDDVGSVTIPDW